MSKKVTLPSKAVAKLPTPVDVEYAIDYIRIDGDRIGTRLIDTVVGATAPLGEDARVASLSLSDLPQAAQNAYTLFADAIVDHIAGLEGNEDLAAENGA